MYRCIKIALAHTELHSGRDDEFGPGTLEFDGTATLTSRAASKKYNTHCGRFLVVFHRESGRYALEPLGDKDVKKGGAPPPESIEDVRPLMQKTIRGHHIVSTDSAPAFKSVVTKHLKVKQVPFVTVVHKNKEFVRLESIRTTSLSPEMRNIAASLPWSTRSALRVKAGDQGAEYTFSAIKRNLHRLNLTRKANGGEALVSINFLAASWLKRSPGMASVAKGIKLYQDALRFKVAPVDMFKDMSWLTALE